MGNGEWGMGSGEWGMGNGGGMGKVGSFYIISPLFLIPLIPPLPTPYSLLPIYYATFPPSQRSPGLIYHSYRWYDRYHCGVELRRNRRGYVRK